MPEPLSVAKLVNALKSQVEPAFTAVSVRGEISNLTLHRSGHAYFTLKDANAALPVACFNASSLNLNVQLKAGLSVICHGRVSIYEPQGRLQLIARAIEADGIGRLQQAFEVLKLKLQAEGLFDPQRKRPIPTLPKRIAVITSPTGAAIRDFLSVLQRRHCVGQIIIVPVRVQGEAAARQIAAALRFVNHHKLADLIVLTRGGGSIEDLWAFNEEITPRAIALSAIPTISAVGHQIDFTLADFAADLRAETPTAAAEFIAAAQSQWRDRLQYARKDFTTALRSQFTALQQRFLNARNTLHANDPSQRVEFFFQRIDDLTHRLQTATDFRFEDAHAALSALRHRHLRCDPMTQIRRLWERFHDAQARLPFALHARLEAKQQALAQLDHRLQRCDPNPHIARAHERLDALRTRLLQASHHATLERGYALVSPSPTNTQPFTRADQLPSPGTPFTLHFKDGHRQVTQLTNP